MTFAGKQLLVFYGSRYSYDDMLGAINLYLRSRNSYKALREILVLPYSKHECEGMQECEKTVKTVSSVPTFANVMLAVMINSFYEAPSFIMYVVTVKNLTAQFLYDVVNTVLKVMHSARGHLFSLMWGNILVNEKTYKVFLKTFGTVASIMHPHKN